MAGRGHPSVQNRERRGSVGSRCLHTCSQQPGAEQPVPMGGWRVSRTRSIHRVDGVQPRNGRSRPRLHREEPWICERGGSVCRTCAMAPPQAPGVSAPQTSSRRAGAGGASCGMGRGSVWEVESPAATVVAAGPGPVPLPQLGGEGRRMFQVFHYNRERSTAIGLRAASPRVPGARASVRNLLGANESESESDHAADVWEPRSEPLPVQPHSGTGVPDAPTSAGHTGTACASGRRGRPARRPPPHGSCSGGEAGLRRTVHP